jgi:HD-like signal output (HDOD) protein
LIAQHWKLPERIVTGIIHHHTPDEAGDLVADVTHVANAVANRVGTGYVAIEEDLVVNRASLDRLRLSAERFEELVAHVAKRLEDVLARYAN